METPEILIIISISESTRARMDVWKASGQSYDSLLIQMLEQWNLKKRFRYPALISGA